MAWHRKVHWSKVRDRAKFRCNRGLTVAEHGNLMVFKISVICHFAFLKLPNFKGRWGQACHRTKYPGDRLNGCRDMAIQTF